MKRCILDGETLQNATQAYRRLAANLGFPAHFGHNPDALWDALSEQRAEPVEIVWRHSARWAERLGPAFDRILAVLPRAAAQGLVPRQPLERSTRPGFNPGGDVDQGRGAGTRPEPRQC